MMPAGLSTSPCLRRWTMVESDIARPAYLVRVGQESRCLRRPPAAHPGIWLLPTPARSASRIFCTRPLSPSGPSSLTSSTTWTFNGEDSSSGEDSGDYGAPELPHSGFLPRSCTHQASPGALAPHSVHEYQRIQFQAPTALRCIPRLTKDREPGR